MFCSKKLIGLVATALIACGSTLPASAVVVTFDDAVGDQAPNDGDFLDSGGFRWTNLEPRSANGFQFVVSNAQAPNNIGPALFSANDADLLMTSADGSPFDLLSFDFARRPLDTTDNRSAEVINVIGNLDGGGMVFFTTADLLDNFVTAALPNSFKGLSSVLFAPVINANMGANNYEFQLDNVTADPVPEPGSLLLLVSALGAVRLLTRRRAAIAHTA